jgi:hypothetical protein
MQAVSSVPFILISPAHHAERIPPKLGIVEVVPKPFDAARLLAIVVSHCHRIH